MSMQLPVPTTTSPALGLPLERLPLEVRIARLLDDTLSIRRRTQRPRLGEELERLTRLVTLAGEAPLTFREESAPRRGELVQWLYGVALGVAASGLSQEALGLLDVLPGVPAGAEGRRLLLAELIACRDARADLAQAS